jgi:hypothetical protein
MKKLGTGVFAAHRMGAAALAARHSRLVRTLAAVALLAGAAYVWATAPGGRALTPGAVLTSATGFAISGTVGNLAPGVSSTLNVTATNPYTVPITLTSLTVSVPSAPANCPVSNLTLNNAAFAGSPPVVTVTGLSQQVPANGGSATIPLTILLARNAPNACQNVTFPFNYTGAASYTAATATSLTASPNPSLFGSPVTFTATVTASSPAPNPAPGTVTFYLCTSPASLAAGSPASACSSSVALGPAVTVNGSGQAALSTASLPGGSYPVFALFTPADPTSYAASSSASITQAVTFSKACITTTVPGFTVASGQAICVNAPGKVTGPVTVNSGGALSLDGAAISSTFSASGAAALRFCGATITGSVSIAGSTGFVLAGDGGDEGQPACAANILKSSLSLSSNSGGFEVASNKITGSASFTGNTGTGPYWQDPAPEIEGNSISGSLSCSGNSPAPADGGQPNTSGPRSGQCSAAGF